MGAAAGQAPPLGPVLLRRQGGAEILDLLQPVVEAVLVQRGDRVQRVAQRDHDLGVRPASVDFDRRQLRAEVSDCGVAELHARGCGLEPGLVLGGREGGSGWW